MSCLGFVVLVAFPFSSPQINSTYSVSPRLEKKISKQEIQIHIFFKDQDSRNETEFTGEGEDLLSSVIYWKGMKKLEADFSHGHAVKGKEAIEEVATRKILIRS